MSKPKTDFEKDNPYVSAGVCAEKHAAVALKLGEMSAELKCVKDALIGTDLQGGLVKKVSDIEGKLNTASTFTNWFKPIIIAVITAAVTAGLLKLLHLS